MSPPPDNPLSRSVDVCVRGRTYFIFMRPFALWAFSAAWLCASIFVEFEASFSSFPSLSLSRSFCVLSRAQCLAAYAVYWILLHSLLLRRVTVTTEGFKSHSALGLAMCQGLLDIHIPSPRSLPPAATTPALCPPLPCYPPVGVVRVLRQLTVHISIFVPLFLFPHHLHFDLSDENNINIPVRQA